MQENDKCKQYSDPYSVQVYIYTGEEYLLLRNMCRYRNCLVISHGKGGIDDFKTWYKEYESYRQAEDIHNFLFKYINELIKGCLSMRTTAEKGCCAELPEIEKWVERS